MTDCCPLCGSKIISDELILLPERHLVCRGEIKVYLTTKQWDLFVRLHQSINKPVSKGVLMDWLYGLENDEPVSKVIDILVMHVRRRIKPLGMEIVTHWGFGVSLEFKGKSRVVQEAA